MADSHVEGLPGCDSVFILRFVDYEIEIKVRIYGHQKHGYVFLFREGWNWLDRMGLIDFSCYKACLNVPRFMYELFNNA